MADPEHIEKYELDETSAAQQVTPRAELVTSEDVETYEPVGDPISVPIQVVLQKHGLIRQKQDHAYRIAANITSGIFALAVGVIFLLAAQSYTVLEHIPPTEFDQYREVSKELFESWVEILDRIKDLAFFVLGAIVGFWFSKDREDV